jgi:hypothetical protein
MITLIPSERNILRTDTVTESFFPSLMLFPNIITQNKVRCLGQKHLSATKVTNGKQLQLNTRKANILSPYIPIRGLGWRSG